MLAERENRIANNGVIDNDVEAHCAVRRLRLRNFRNYHQLALDLTAPIVVLSGANGAGKTNLMEAISFLSPGRGLRRARLRDVQKADVEFIAGDSVGHNVDWGWSIAATVLGPTSSGSNDAVKIGSSLTRTERGTDKRLARHDGQTIQPAS